MGPQDRSGRFWRGKDFLAFTGIRSPDRLSRSLVTIRTELFRFELVLMIFDSINETESSNVIFRNGNFCFPGWKKLLKNCHLIWGHAVAQLVKTLRYKPEGRGFGMFH